MTQHTEILLGQAQAAIEQARASKDPVALWRSLKDAEMLLHHAAAINEREAISCFEVMQSAADASWQRYSEEVMAHS